MKQNRRATIRKILLSVLALAGLVVIWYGFLSLRYSPEYVYREVFMDLGNADDYLTMPARELTASPNPFHFQVGTSKEAQVREAFQSSSKIEDLDSFLEKADTWAFMVIQNDTIIYERYFRGYQHDAAVTSFSVAKSFDSALIGMAIQDGYIKSAEDPITDYIPELAKRDPRFQDVQIRHLLMMASGLAYDDNRLLLPEDDNLTYGFDDLRKLALNETKIASAPGATFVYNNYNPLLLGLILERATGKSVTAYLQEKIWTPLGMEYPASWSLDSQKSGFEKMESGLNARPVDFAKFGRLYLNEGNWNGQQILPSEWVSLSTQDHGLLEDAPYGYGYMWWVDPCHDQGKNFFALGNYGQFIYVSPEKNLIIVRNGEKIGLPRETQDWTDLFCTFTETIQ